MFNDIGKKIKLLAEMICIVGIIFSIIVGLVNASLYNEKIIFSVVMWLIGPLLSWIGSFTLYGFGELIDKVTSIEKS